MQCFLLKKCYFPPKFLYNRWHVHTNKTLLSCLGISREKLEAFLIHAMEVGLVSDGALAQDINQALSFWLLREVSFCLQLINSDYNMG